MKYGILYAKYGILQAIVFFCAALLWQGCRTTRNVKEDSVEQEHVQFVQTVAADTIAEAGELVTQTADTMAVEAQEVGTLEIDRDSMGLPVRFVWSRNISLTGNRTESGHHRYSFAGAGSSTRAQVGGTTDKERKRHEEKKTEVRTPSLEDWIGAGLMGLLCFCLFYAFIQDRVLPWIKKRLRR